MGQKGGEKWTAEADLQPTISKSDRLLANQAPQGPAPRSGGAFFMGSARTAPAYTTAGKTRISDIKALNTYNSPVFYNLQRR